MKSTILNKTRRKVLSAPHYYLPLFHGTANISEIARRLKKELEAEGIDVSIRSVINALSAIEEELSRKADEISALKDLKIIAESGIAIVEGVEVPDAIAVLNFSGKKISVVRAENLPSGATALHGYAAVLLEIPKKVVNMPGVLSLILEVLASFSINLVEIATMREQILFVVEENELSQAVSALLYLKNTFAAKAKSTIARAT